MTGRALTIYLDIRQLTENLCISERTADNWVAQGLIPPPHRVGGKRLWLTADVRRYIEQGPPRDQAELIREATKKAASGRR